VSSTVLNWLVVVLAVATIVLIIFLFLGGALGGS
jgi:hypothetical protein